MDVDDVIQQVLKVIQRIWTSFMGYTEHAIEAFVSM